MIPAPSFRKVVVVLGALGSAAAAILLLSDYGQLASVGGSSEDALLFFREDSQILSAARRAWREGSPEGRDRALKLFRRALVRDPASPFRWCDLAEVLAGSGDTETARSCFARAEELGRYIPPILMRISNFHLTLGETQQSLRYASMVLGLASDYDDVIFSRYKTLNLSLEEILRDGIPSDRRAAQSYFRTLLKDGVASDLEHCWIWIRRNGFSDDRMATEYVSNLIANRMFERAGSVWAEHIGERRGDYLRTTKLYNGGFEFEPTGSALDWSLEQAQGVIIARDVDRVHSGRYSLRVAFNGCCDAYFDGIRQCAIVDRGWYEFSAMASAENVTTDSGLFFRIFDPESPKRLDVRTEQILGTTPWIRLAREFFVPAETRLVTVQVLRTRSNRLDNKIGGTVWFDDVSLSRAPAANPRRTD